jgi:hypothetical protein
VSKFLFNQGMRESTTGFLPTDLAGLEGWYDASDAGTITLNGSNVSQWDDKSGNDNHAVQATASEQPAYELYEGLQGVVFEDNDVIAAPSSGANSRNDLCLVAVHNFANLTSIWNMVLAVKNEGVTSGALIIQRMSSSDEIGVHDAGNQDVRISVDTGSDAELKKLRVTMVNRIGGSTAGLGDDVTVRSISDSQNLSTTQAQSWGTDAATTRIQIGGRQQTSVGWMRGAIHEALVFKRGLSAGEMNLVMNYLTEKWGIT